MELPRDSYKVDIIHYLNPHLLWIEVRDPSVQKKFMIEQIGVYGVLPMEKTLFISNVVELDSQKCEEWALAAIAVMKHLFAGSDEVWFSPTRIVMSTSIFDDNIHKYGELIVKTKEGKFKRLSKSLVKSGFADYNISEFCEKVSRGQLKTKLSMSETEKVIKELLKHHTENTKSMDEWKKSIESQTSVFQMCQIFEMSLTESNLEKQLNTSLNKTIQNKFKDFELCKDIDELSLRRGCKIKTDLPDSNSNVQKSMFITRRLQLYKQMNNLLKPDDIKP